jgi:hypothetical protein
MGANDFNGDTGADILFQNDNGGRLAIWTMPGVGTRSITGMFPVDTTPTLNWHIVGTGDTTGDQRAGIIWQNNNGALVMWEDPTFTTNTTHFNVMDALPALDLSWRAKGMGDFKLDARRHCLPARQRGGGCLGDE